MVRLPSPEDPASVPADPDFALVSTGIEEGAVLDLLPSAADEKNKRNNSCMCALCVLSERR